MSAPRILSFLAMVLTVPGIAVLTAMDGQLTQADLISRLNEIGAEHQSLASGLFFLIGIFWIGTIDSTRRSLEPAVFDPWLRFSTMAFAASYLLSMVFPCDEGCTTGGSLSQWLHLTLVWGLYYGPVVFAVRRLPEASATSVRLLCVGVLLFSVALHIDLLFFDRATAGWWQRGYDLLFCALWWQVQSHLLQRSAD